MNLGQPKTHQGLYDPAYEHDACGVGFVVDMKGRRSHKIVTQALTVLRNLMHRGACGCEENTGDGAGILIQMPHVFLSRECGKLGIELPKAGHYGTGLVFLPRADAEARRCQDMFAGIVREEGQALLGWRDVPVDHSSLGPTACSAEPVFQQIFIGRAAGIADDMTFERKLYVIRKRIEHAIWNSDLKERSQFYIPSLSARTLIYKGMLTPTQVEPMFPDLADPAVESALALVHSRFSTNTFPSWPLAHPYRYIAHNGEINTLRGNINWMRAREALCQSPLFGDDLKKILPIVMEGGSDSATFDNVLEFLHMAGRELPHAVLMMIPEAWSGHETMDEDRKAFYEYHGCLMEPWDGPASIAFTDGTVIGAILDRNGLRPSRYYVTKDGLVVMASEVGVLDIPPENVLIKERLHPGRIFLVDTRAGRIIDDAELKQRYTSAHPYRDWLKQNLVPLDQLPKPPQLPGPDHATVLQRQQAFGYTHEDLRILMAPMAQKGEEPVGSMGNDAALAVLSEKPRLLYDYFKQLFAQVTNPPLDAIREELVTQIETPLGPEGNLLQPGPESCRLLKLKTPILGNEELAKIRHLDRAGFKTVALPMLFPAGSDGPGLTRALEELCMKASEAISQGCTFIVLSDRGVDAQHMPMPALLATSGVHHHLVRAGTRVKVGLIVESGEPRETHHMALLLGYGAGAVNPYLAFETLDDLIRQDLLNGVDQAQAVKNYIKALNKGVVKAISKMGISTIQSYRGAQIFEAIGLDKAFVDKYFTWTASRVGGIGIDVVAQESSLRHHRAYPERPVGPPELDWGGHYQWRRDGEYHMLNPDTVAKLQHATRANSYEMFREFSRACDDSAQHLATLRGLMELKLADRPIPIGEVESVESIMQRFATGAMSYGSISLEAHEALAIAMNRIGGRSNCGEGGEDPERYGTVRNSRVKQVASGRFGVTSHYLVNATDLQIKMAQGAKPGEGGQLPGHKVYPWIAKVRYSTPGVGLISPPPHHDIYSIEDLAQLIHDLKNANRQARIHVKLVSEVGVGTIAAGVAKAHADVVLISGDSGGTGASPLSSLKHAGLPWELGVAETQQVLVMNNLRDRITVQTDGQMKTGRDVVIAALLGAEEYGFSSAPLVVLGCIMMRVCHLNTCPVGIATQDPELRKKFAGNPEHVVSFFRFVAQETREWMARLGFRSMDEMIGRVDRLNVKKAVDHWKARGLDFSQILYQPDMGPEVATRRVRDQDHGLGKSLDVVTILPLCRDALESKKPVDIILPIHNVNRTVGTILGSEVSRRYGAEGLPEDTIRIHFNGSAGQSFGAFLPRGITFTIEGDANDYIGKGLSGGKLIVYPPRQASFVPEENILIGNVALYGATGGEAYFRGVAGERFSVRNSGAHTVVEGVGDHGCEYMTGGRVLVIGPTGRNFAAGMSGGVAYVLDTAGDFKRRCNLAMVDIDPLSTAEDADLVKDLLKRHVHHTGSTVAKKILANWKAMQAKFVKVTPKDYKRVLAAISKARQIGISEEQAVMEAAHG
ncbi:MAG: glutamate synthase subunit alpha [Candidatus Muproteobacteria bacterium RIFCSPHIGHO2_12_FULL_60_33]|uniref:Glutamate synthase [NADPH] large chain n=1 Tax=Candidatus Muproteobacteria bacterium RIFCSPLOWO2_01_FULL_60_18 TaxID=1817768 RepID=A0A1F6U535_9PROT|nr:MAG: glutamate synthase subunit alpha [Candidatus Muproteobacteria bacterium RIFCSPHIGHO2_01_60_12]OGI52467.1 MAG: glutamate synthase subunit alpha [Candidatus Muproteobacteria bacterium RIFCSPLOWO2_01_FULL_60_18]OGI54404.1 MAG: glutamate synthase subunit alpha [Candidatus Muproteobacteria bacterium RIFCSPHIGHO2_12_FULL_60_33]OGI57707.1 MAG: glutamate synthase subunit alpha [Candidatus Muproteobacteria bacterium RIFCSPHIGHO2_01_FULL_61_200]